MLTEFCTRTEAMLAEVGTWTKAMLAEFGARTEVMFLDHDGFSACNRRRGNSDRPDGCNNVAKPLHVILLIV